MSLRKLVMSILWGGCLFFALAPRAEAYVCLSAGSLITQMIFSSFLLITVSIRAMFLMRFKTCLSPINHLSNSIRQKLGKCKGLIGLHN